jgi:squalene-associated FAD-dependent desaturase
MRVAVIGAGWAGLAAAVRAAQAAHVVTLFDMAPLPGGRARSDSDDRGAFDNGQHLLLGGYARTLGLMRDVGVDLQAALLRSPLDVRWPDGTGLRLRGQGPRWLDAFTALLRAPGFAIADKLSLVRSARAWRRTGFDCDASLTAARLLERTATPRLRRRLLDPLCVAALNTPVDEASARVFLAVLRDSLFGERVASDLLVPRVPLGHLLPVPALNWLERAGARVRLRERVIRLERESASWRLQTDRLDAFTRDRFADDEDPGDGRPSGGTSFDERFDRVIVATSAAQAARLCAGHSPAWSQCAARLAHEPIATLWLRAPRRPWPSSMMAWPSDVERPAQFAFRLPRPHDRSAPPAESFDLITLVVSAAAPWVERGLPALREAALAQAAEVLALRPGEAIDCLEARIDRRATFRCVAGVERPPAQVGGGLIAAGDYVESPYPATLEAAVRSGEAAAAAVSMGAR